MFNLLAGEAAKTNSWTTWVIFGVLGVALIGLFVWQAISGKKKKKEEEARINNLKIGTYTIYAEYGEFKVSNKITVKTTLITKNVKIKKGKIIKFKVKLLNSKGKILKSKKITFKFKGKTYKVKTNKKGIATLKIKKNYKIGKYNIITRYGKVKITNVIRIVK